MSNERLSNREDSEDNSNETAKMLNHYYRIQGLAETLLPIFVRTNLDEEDTREAVEQAIKKVF